ncbi:MAG: hypothetical protein DRJ28_05285 [Actinobacteria bacterium]|nr:MAG: hypothetical protein DRJ28_05285 [Actinomycetota bacterium]
MTRRISTILAVLVLVVSACGDGGVSADLDGADVVGPAFDESTTSAGAAVPTTAETQAITPTGVTGSGSSEVTALRAAFVASADVTSGRMEGSIEVSGLDRSQGITEMVIPFGGTFDNTSGDFSFFMDMSGVAVAGKEMPSEIAGLFGEMEVRQIGDIAYVKFPFFNMFLGAETPWIAMPADESDPTGGFSMTSPGNPSEILGSFEHAGATVEVIGPETVNGVDATHYRAVFDTEALFAQATPEERKRLEAQGPIPTDSMPMDVWISDEGLVVRFIMEIDGDSVDAESGESFDLMLMRYDMFELNSGIVIEPPPPGDVTHVEDLAPSFEFDA